ncbi:MAG TPA: cytochrome c [Terriglobia bacterium]|nr:cytochrome c [Terriglobia bacterium]
MTRTLVLAALVAFGCAWTLSVEAQRGATRPRVQPPQGLVRDVIFKNCTSCHGIDEYAYFALDRAGWQMLLETRHKPGEAPISDPDRAVLLDWLADKFGPSTRPFPRSYVAPEIKTFFSDPEARRLIDRACSGCHDIERVNKARLTEEAWRVLAVDMRERGATLTDEELEKLVEWLGRVQGTTQSQ